MLDKMKAVLLGTVITLATIGSANAGLIVFSDRAAFEDAVNGSLDFEGFNDSNLLDDALTLSNSRYRTTSSLVSEGERALSLSENNDFSIEFAHDVFAIGFDLNELNGSTFSYLDSAGHQIVDAFKITDIWNESTFFGVISDTALSSFSLISSDTASSSARYGFDALSFTAGPTPVPTPATGVLLAAGLLCFLAKRRRLNQ